MYDMRIPTLHVGQGSHFGAVTVFPVWTEGREVRGLVTGTAARIESAEREGDPVVEELVLTNRGAAPARLLGGELLEGGMQHRALNHDVVLMPGQMMVASVSCVERGRWHGGAGQVRRGRRASVMVRSAQAMTPGGDRQQQVWDRVSRYDAAYGASATASYVDHLDRRGSLPAASGTDAAANPAGDIGGIRSLAGQRGVLIGLGGQPACLELFASTTGLRRHLGALLQAAAVDAALLPADPTPGRRARRFVERLSTAPLHVDTAVDAGAGRALASRSVYHDVRGLEWTEQLVHATIFNRRHPLMEAV
jgi:hypothetical protein